MCPSPLRNGSSSPVNSGSVELPSPRPPLTAYQPLEMAVASLASPSADIDYLSTLREVISVTSAARALALPNSKCKEEEEGYR